MSVSAEQTQFKYLLEVRKITPFSTADFETFAPFLSVGTDKHVICPDLSAENKRLGAAERAKTKARIVKYFPLAGLFFLKMPECGKAFFFF